MLSHVGIVGNEQADKGAAQGAKRSLQHLREHRLVDGIWEELGLQEMDEDSSCGSLDAGWRTPTYDR